MCEPGLPTNHAGYTIPQDLRFNVRAVSRSYPNGCTFCKQAHRSCTRNTSANAVTLATEMVVLSVGRTGDRLSIRLTVENIAEATICSGVATGATGAAGAAEAAEVPLDFLLEVGA